MIAVLYVDEKGPYVKMPGVEAWGETRGGQSYAGPHPIVAHPPCGPWGLCRDMCYLQDASLAPIAVEQVRRWGGVLEHPVGSRLWKHAGLPPPGKSDPWGVTVRVEQVSWGHACRKPTLLYCVGVDRAFLARTLRTGGTPTHKIASRAKRRGLLAPSSAMRRRTPPDFADWLVALAETAWDWSIRLD